MNGSKREREMIHSQAPRKTFIVLGCRFDISNSSHTIPTHTITFFIASLSAGGSCHFARLLPDGVCRGVGVPTSLGRRLLAMGTAWLDTNTGARAAIALSLHMLAFLRGPLLHCDAPGASPLGRAHFARTKQA